MKPQLCKVELSFITPVTCKISTNRDMITLISRTSGNFLDFTVSFHTDSFVVIDHYDYFGPSFKTRNGKVLRDEGRLFMLPLERFSPAFM